MQIYYFAFMAINAVIFSDLYFMMSDPFKSQKSRLFNYYILIVAIIIIVFIFPMFFGNNPIDVFDDLDYYWAVGLMSYLIISFSVLYTIRRLKKHGTS